MRFKLLLFTGDGYFVPFDEDFYSYEDAEKIGKKLDKGAGYFIACLV